MSETLGMFIGDKCCGENKAGNYDKGMRREVTTGNMTDPLTCPLSRLEGGQEGATVYLGKRVPRRGVKCQSPEASLCGG